MKLPPLSWNVVAIGWAVTAVISSMNGRPWQYAVVAAIICLATGEILRELHHRTFWRRVDIIRRQIDDELARGDHHHRTGPH